MEVWQGKAEEEVERDGSDGRGELESTRDKCYRRESFQNTGAAAR